MPNLLKKYTCILLLLAAAAGGAAQPVSTFSSITGDLVNNEVTAIVRDNSGFIWLGTRGGLQRYDGYEMKLMGKRFAGGDNLMSQSIEVLLPGKKNTLWIGTKSGGLSRYDLKTGRISNFLSANQTPADYNTDYILSLLETPSGNLLVGTWQGFGSVNSSNGQFSVINKRWKTFDIQSDDAGGYWLATNNGLRHLDAKLENDQSYNFGVPNINITSIVNDRQSGCLWLGTWDKGLIQFYPGSQQFSFYRHQPGNPASLSSDNTYKLLHDSRNNLWVGTWGGGLNRFDKESKTFRQYPLSIPGLFTTDDRIILSIMEDPSGLLWVGTDGAGIFKYDLDPKKFNNIGYSGLAPLSGGTHVLSAFTDPFSKLWVSTKGGCIQYAEEGKPFTCLPLISSDTETGAALPFEARCYLQDSGYLWIGSNKGLIRMINTAKGPGPYEFYLPRLKDSTSIPGKKINALARDQAGRLWIGTQEFGISRITGYDSKGQPLFKNYLPDFGRKGALQNERVSCLLLDSKKRFWIGTYKGLHLYNPATDQFIAFFQTGDGKQSLSNNTILCLAEDPSGNIWAGTQNGLNQITGVTGDKLSVNNYTTNDGLPSSYIHAIIPDARGHIWASTNKGIIRLNTSTQSITVFDKRDGVQSVVFSENAAFTDAKGRFFFGGLEGLTYFRPDSITISRFTPPVYFTNLWVNNRPYEFIPSGKRSDSTRLTPVYETKSITLTHKENILSVEFAALDFHAPDKNEYMYKLEGFNPDWVYAGNKRSVSFTNLRSGNYQLMVKASNSDKIWNEEARTLNIKILPPPWKTWWAYTIYVALFLFLLWLTRYLGLRQEALKSQLRLSRLARQQENEWADYKDRLFTNISHEFRTPLTLIQGPVEDLLQRKKFELPVEKCLLLVQKQSKRMLRMVNQLLDYQKAEAGRLQLTPQPGEIVSFCQDIFQLFRDEAARRNIRYTMESDEKYISFHFDHNKLDIILFNILSNAFKFTPDGGRITLSVRNKREQGLQIMVSDTGSGIPPQELDRIFDRFYRGKQTDATNISGTGIGLSFVKELAELHRGTIKAESDGKNGSTFTIELPRVKEETGTAPFSPPPLQPSPEERTDPKIAATMTAENESSVQEPQQPILLVVEDEPDMRQYICEILSPSYQVVTAVNGREGLEKAFEFIPDLVVSDVMMPEMDGIELCKRLKSDKNTSHIPIILLTALSDMQHHVQGIREGADVYLPKPFNSQLLLVHIHNLINIRNTLKELYAKKVFLGTSNFEIKSFEEEFLFKLMKLVEENISNSEFNNDELANQMFMSRSTFYRKLKAVTGMSGNEFIRTARLNYAAKLLESGKYSVTEAAYDSGFNDIKYFRQRFQDQFGVSPSEYKK